MKKILALVSAIALLSGCSKNSPAPVEGRNISSSTEKTISSAPLSAASVSQSTKDSPESTASSSKTIPKMECTATSVTDNPVDTNVVPTDISDYINTLNNGDMVFVDYKFNENPDVITDKNALGEVYDKALKALKATNEYKNFVDNFSLDYQMGFISRQTEDFLENSVPTPIFKSAYMGDFDHDGKSESFVLISMAKPMGDGSDCWGERDFLVYIGDSAEVVGDYYGAKFDAVLDYGSAKQVIVRSEGWNGNDRLSNIWGVAGGKAKNLYGGRLDFIKTDCFLYSTGTQQIGDLAVYDTVNNEYLAIQGKKLSSDTVKAMDKSDSLGKVQQAMLVGGKYYIINVNGVFTYENGEFVKSDKKDRASATPGLTGDALNTRADIDYGKAVSSMITP